MNYSDDFWDVLLGFTVAFTTLLFVEWMLYYPEPIMSHLTH